MLGFEGVWLCEPFSWMRTELQLYSDVQRTGFCIVKNNLSAARFFDSLFLCRPDLFPTNWFSYKTTAISLELSSSQNVTNNFAQKKTLCSSVFGTNFFRKNSPLNPPINQCPSIRAQEIRDPAMIPIPDCARNQSPNLFFFRRQNGINRGRRSFPNGDPCLKGII